MFNKIYNKLKIVYLSIQNKLKIVYLSIQNKLPLILGNIFTLSNLNKVIIIFIFGFISRVFIAHFYDVNVFTDYLHKISIIYYSFMAGFIVIIHEFINVFQFNILPSFIFDFYYVIVNILNKVLSLGYFVCKTINKGNSLIFSIKLSDLNIISIKKDFRLFLNSEKMTLDCEIKNNKENIVNKTIEDKQNDNVLQRNSLKSSRGRSSISKTGESGNNNNSSSSNIENPGRSNNGANSNNTPYTLPPHYPAPGEYVRGNVYHENPSQEFIVETIRDSVASQLGEGERTLATPEPRIPNTPNLKGDNLSTPSMSSLNTNDTPRFEPITSLSSGNPNNRTVNTLPAAYSSTNNSYNSDYITYYNNAYYNTNGHAYPVPGEVGYFNPARVSSDTHHATIGLNASNENMHNNFDTNSVN
jgi:hypothetical protein